MTDYINRPYEGSRTVGVDMGMYLEPRALPFLLVLLGRLKWGPNTAAGPAALGFLAPLLGGLEVSQLTGPQGTSGREAGLPTPSLPNCTRSRPSPGPGPTPGTPRTRVYRTVNLPWGGCSHTLSPSLAPSLSLQVLKTRAPYLFPFPFSLNWDNFSI